MKTLTENLSILCLSTCLASSFVMPRESNGQDTQASLRVSILESYEKVRSAKQQLAAAQLEFEAIEAEELVKVIKLLQSLAEVQTKSGQLSDAKESYAKLLEYAPNDKAAARFFESTGADTTKKQILTTKFLSNAEAALDNLSIVEARKWVLAAASISREDPKLVTLLSRVNAIERALQVGNVSPSGNSSTPTEWHSKNKVDGKPESTWKKRAGRQWFEVLQQNGQVFTNNYMLIVYTDNVAVFRDTGNSVKVRIHQDGTLYYQRVPATTWTLGYNGSWQK